MNRRAFTIIAAASLALAVYLITVGSYNGGFHYCSGAQPHYPGWNYIVELNWQGLMISRSHSDTFDLNPPISMGSLISLASVLPVLWLLTLRVEEPTTTKCEKCGYDLRASPDRCPECGTKNPGVADGRENIAKRVLIHAAGCNIGIMMRVRYGLRKPRSHSGGVFVLFLSLFILLRGCVEAIEMILPGASKIPHSSSINRLARRQTASIAAA